SRRLDALAEIAQAEDFKLAIIYEGLDFERRPLPVAQVEADLDYFIARYGDNPTFALFGKPMVVWSGTWEFSREQVAETLEGRRGPIEVLASERSVEGYRRLADLVDGNAYYWSSVDPTTYSGYEQRLASFGQAVHEGHGRWIAPAAPGFDARLVG